MIFDTQTQLTLYLIRHGESYMNKDHKDLIGGRSGETELSKSGRRQAELLGQYIQNNDISIDALYSSSLIRAKQTAELLNSQLQEYKQIIFTDKLVEFSQGEWEKQPRKEIYTDKNKGFINQQEIFFTPPSGESKSMVISRVSQWLQDEVLNNIEGSKNAAVVCHGLVIKCLLFHIMNFNDSLIHKIDIDNTSISKLTFDHTGWKINYINRTPHLD